jgi:hypothetical protein
MSLANENFVVIDHPDPRYLCFSTLKSLQGLYGADHLFLDGTFRSCPSPFAQLYTIHIHSPILNGTVPLLYCLLPNKTKKIYALLFNELRTVAIQNGLVLNPLFITTDFEQGAISALRNVFPNASIQSCNFHYNQCIFKKIQELGLQKDYLDSSPDDSTSVKSLVEETSALAFIV